jgi:hypothetical protein
MVDASLKNDVALLPRLVQVEREDAVVEAQNANAALRQLLEEQLLLDPHARHQDANGQLVVHGPTPGFEKHKGPSSKGRRASLRGTTFVRRDCAAASAGVLVCPRSVTGAPGWFYWGEFARSSNCSEVFSIPAIAAGLAPYSRSLWLRRSLPVLVNALIKL